MTILLLVFAAIGLVIAQFFWLATSPVMRPHLPLIPRFCRLEGKRCAAVLGHRDARVLGLPNVLAGACYYLLLIIVIAIAGTTGAVLGALTVASWVAFGLSLFLLFSLIARVRVFCPLCVAAHVINGIIAMLLLVSVLHA
jgi:uncharacterized membrane protein